MILALIVVIFAISAIALSAEEISSAKQPLPKIGLKQVNSKNRKFIELDSRREVFFHGVNNIVKGSPYIPLADKFDPDISLSEQDHVKLAELGVNVYRLGFMWKGAEPVRGEYNQTYFDAVRRITSEASKKGIYTLFDMHQDVISEKYCGEGVPDWAISAESNEPSSDAFPAPEGQPFTAIASDGYPTREDCAKFGWPSYYQTKSVAKAFGELYSESGFLNDWSNYWGEISRQFKDESAVLGYELINEPYAGNIFANPSLLVPSVADRKQLQPAYDTISKSIRQNDNQTLIFFAAVTWDDIVPVGFDHAPGGPQNAPTSVFAYHYYEPPQYDTKSYFFQRTNDAQRLEVGMFLSEFERQQNNEDYDNDPFFAVADAADFHQVSWTMWEYKTFCKETTETLNGDSQAAAFGSCKTGYGELLIWDSDGKVNPSACKKLARTYAQKVAGETVSMKFDARTGFFDLVWLLDSSISLPTEVFAHMGYNYPNGFDIITEPPGKIVWKQRALNSNMIDVLPTPLAKDGDRLRFSIRAL